MQTVSSASRTCIASASAVEWTATVLIPISWQARWILSAISPRLAISSFLICISLGSANHDERLVELDRLTVADEQLLDDAPGRRGDRVHDLHRLDDEEGVARLHRIADLDELFGVG